jgi:glutamate-1-semialdehyde 2,1-aminomutase
MFLDSDIFDRANQCIAQGALTNSKHAHRFVFGSYPTHIKDAYQCFVVDTKDNVYTDYICGLGPNILGYGNHLVEGAVAKYHRMGASHSLPTIYEVEAAEKLKEAFTFVDKWKFLKTGSEACLATLKIARAHTGRKLILSDGYHGHGDEFISLMEPALGVCGSGYIQKLNDYKGDYKDVAAVIVEPVITVCDDNRRSYLNELRRVCSASGAMLIFDEVITGLRFPRLSVANYWDIKPDLIILGKCLANGRSLAAVGGKAEWMDKPYFVSSTYAGEVAPLVACRQVVEILLHNNHPEYDLAKLWEQGQAFIDRFNSLLKPFVWIEGYPTRGAFKWSDEKVWACFMEKAIGSRILVGPSWFYNFDLAKYDFNFFEFAKEFRKFCDRGEFNLKGQMPTSPFSAGARK